MAASMKNKIGNDGDKDYTSHVAKKLKIASDSDSDIHENVLHDLNGFEIDQILSENAQGKSLFLLGSFAESADKAIVLLEKKPFPSDDITLQSLMSKDTTLKLVLKNDIYGVYEGFPPVDINGIKTTVIYPATEKHVRKYKKEVLHLVTESYDDYQSITLPYLNEQQFSIQWVYNILEKKAETEQVIYEDPNPDTGFVLLPDMKWDGKQTDALYLIAICHARDVMSLRDLNKDHLPLLRNIREKCVEAVKTKYNIGVEHLRMYVHYQPSYYHLHVHVTHLRNTAPGTQTEKAHLLNDIIQNIELLPDYYQRKCITFTLRENNDLLNRFRKAGKLE